MPPPACIAFGGVSVRRGERAFQGEREIILYGHTSKKITHTSLMLCLVLEFEPVLKMDFIQLFFLNLELFSAQISTLP